jgi:hypothetical protein
MGGRQAFTNPTSPVRLPGQACGIAPMLQDNKETEHSGRNRARKEAE